MGVRRCRHVGRAGELDYSMDRCYTQPGRPLRAAHPARLGRLVVATARYLQLSPRLVPQLVEVAADLYFLSALDGG